MHTNKRPSGIGGRLPFRLLLLAAGLNAAGAASLIDEWKASTVFWKQDEIGQKIIAAGDRSVLPQLAPYLSHEDRHIRGNAALIFGGFGDPRGFEVITGILNDRSDRPEGQAAAVSSVGVYSPILQIQADRYYAVHLLGELKDPKAIPVLIPLLNDPDLNYKVPWSLGQIGGEAAIQALIQALQNPSEDVRVVAIDALQTLHARDALPALRGMLNDHTRSHFGKLVTVSEAAQTAITAIEAKGN